MHLVLVGVHWGDNDRTKGDTVQTLPVAVTPKRSIRIDDSLWEAATARAKERRESVVDVVRRALIAYVERTCATCGSSWIAPVDACPTCEREAGR